MAQRGKPSTAHEYDERGACIHCGMYKSHIDNISHVCIAKRELEVDEAAAKKLKVKIEDYRSGGFIKDGQWQTI